MPDERRRSRRAALRFMVYGVLLGLVAGVPLGIGFATRDWLPVATVDATAATNLRRPRPIEQFNTDGLLVADSLIIHGGPGKGGIPALDEPATVDVRRVDFLDPGDRVIGVDVNGAARAYPIRLLNYHEIVNDELGGVPIGVVYCPLCDSVSVVDRRLGGETLSFGVSGMLLHSNLLMYDRNDDSLWTQLGFRALSGPHAGSALKHINTWAIASFATWAADHPNGSVASFATGHDRNYGQSPYASYLRNDGVYYPVPPDDRLPRRKEPVIGIRLGDRAWAVPVAHFATAPDGRLSIPIGQEWIEVRTAPAENGALQAKIVDAPHGTEVVHAFWFAWAAFHPATEIIGAAAASPPATRPLTEPRRMAPAPRETATTSPAG